MSSGLLQWQKDAFRKSVDNDDLSRVILVMAIGDWETSQLVAQYVATDNNVRHAELIFKMGERWIELAKDPDHG